MKVVFGQFAEYNAEEMKKSDNLSDLDFIALNNLTDEGWDKDIIASKLQKVRVKLEDIFKSEEQGESLVFLRGEGEVQDFISSFLKEAGFKVEERFINEEASIKKQRRKEENLKSNSKLDKQSWLTK